MIMSCVRARERSTFDASRAELWINPHPADAAVAITHLET